MADCFARATKVTTTVPSPGPSVIAASKHLAPPLARMPRACSCYDIGPNRPNPWLGRGPGARKDLFSAKHRDDPLAELTGRKREVPLADG